MREDASVHLIPRLWNIYDEGLGSQSVWGFAVYKYGGKSINALLRISLTVNIYYQSFICL